MKPAGAPGRPSACRTLVPSLTEHGHAAQCRGRAAAPTCTRGRRGVRSLPRPPRPPAPAAVLPFASGGVGGRMARRPSRPGDGRPRRALGQGPRHGEARAARRGGAATLTGGRRVVLGLTDRSASLAPVPGSERLAIRTAPAPALATTPPAPRRSSGRGGASRPCSRRRLARPYSGVSTNHTTGPACRAPRPPPSASPRPTNGPAPPSRTPWGSGGAPAPPPPLAG